MLHPFLVFIGFPMDLKGSLDVCLLLCQSTWTVLRADLYPNMYVQSDQFHDE